MTKEVKAKLTRMEKARLAKVAPVERAAEVISAELETARARLEAMPEGKFRQDEVARLEEELSDVR